MATKIQHKDKLLKYLGNPENKWLSRCELSTKVLGFKNEQGIHKVFTSAEINEIDKEALEIRRKKYTGALSRIDRALIKEAEGGDAPSIKLAYQRFEDWNPAKKLEHGINDSLKEFMDGIDGETSRNPEGKPEE